MRSLVDIVVGPSEEPITLAEAKQHLRVCGAHEDLEVAAYLTAAREWLEDVAGSALIKQTLRYTLDEFSCSAEICDRPTVNGRIYLPGLVLQSVSSIKYTDPAGTEQTLDVSKYTVVTSHRPGFVVPAYDEEWPDTRDEASAVRIEYVAGYGAAEDVPAAVKQALKVMLTHLYDNRGSVSSEPPTAALMLIGPYRRWGLA